MWGFCAVVMVAETVALAVAVAVVLAGAVAVAVAVAGPLNYLYLSEVADAFQDEKKGKVKKELRENVINSRGAIVLQPTHLIILCRY